eukprot:CAMPEP_0194583918 /NCGR_PEP_ID=MMETSP0292-20121207/16674_1 /TAXON_ID=39354 /ORGANISM="Heterosigma akashiwo, Strain CCMP2393" /LENGTH=80 /DNA_ID=CAMNT_0039438729 /DNA_START=297 /DNA_END=535 /DNA_ORIENTATION=-
MLMSFAFFFLSFFLPTGTEVAGGQPHGVTRPDWGAAITPTVACGNVNLAKMQLWMKNERKKMQHEYIDSNWSNRIRTDGR